MNRAMGYQTKSGIREAARIQGLDFGGGAVSAFPGRAPLTDSEGFGTP
jgi:hypothetical protein